jgi:hypothetical protein
MSGWEESRDWFEATLEGAFSEETRPDGNAVKRVSVRPAGGAKRKELDNKLGERIA